MLFRASQLTLLVNTCFPRVLVAVEPALLALEFCLYKPQPVTAELISTRQLTFCCTADMKLRYRQRQLINAGARRKAPRYWPKV